MKRLVAVVSKSDSTGGGASRIASQLAALLNRFSDYEAHHWVGLPPANPSGYTRKLHGGRWLSLLHGACAVSSRAAGFPDFFTPELLIHLLRKQVDYDLYHFHDISFTFSPLAVNWLGKRHPVVWTMHDCSSFTGGCIFPLSCSAFHSRCRNCPQLSTMPMGTKFDFTGWMQGYKQRIFTRQRAVLVSPSCWLVQEARKSKGFDSPVEIIPNSVDHQVFRRANRSVVREALGLPPDRFMVLFSATSLGDARKGLHFALEAVREVSPKPYVLVVGQIEPSVAAALQGIEHHISGYVYNDVLLAQYYAAADLLLFTSLADNLPTVILETMACGTPTIAFRTGGIPEMVSHDVDGWLTEPGNVADLVAGLSRAMADPSLVARWGDACVAKSTAEYTANRFLADHLALYERAITAFGGGLRCPSVT
jgi:glycosyltransferase involved in cell wall biosynthesis